MTLDLKTALAAAAIVLAVTAPAHAASDRADAVALGKQLFALANAEKFDDIAKLVASGDHEIIDNFAPFHWSGPNGYTAWLTSYGEDVAANHVTGAHSVMGKASYVKILGDTAYVVAPDTYTYKRAGKPVREDLIWSYVARKTPTGWKLVSWSFAGGPRR